jgi:hypothetical protein
MVSQDIHVHVRPVVLVSHLVDGLQDLTSNFTPGIKPGEVSVLWVVIESEGVVVLFIAVLK